MDNYGIGTVSVPVGMESEERTTRRGRDVLLSSNRSCGEDHVAGCCDLAACPYHNSGDSAKPWGSDARFRWNGSGHNGNGHRTCNAMSTPALWRKDASGAPKAAKGQALRKSELPWSQSAALAVTPVHERAQFCEQAAAWQDLQKEWAEKMRVLVHELRAPVAASKTLVTTIQYLNPEDPEVQFMLSRIDKRMDQLLNLVDDIVHLSCVKTGDPLGEPVEFDLVAVSRSVCEPYLEEASAKGLAMRLDLPESPVQVCMAEQAYRLILSNLASNAVKYTPDGSVRVILRREEAWVVLQVKDSGIGIPPDEISRLFTEFFRASNARRGRYPGTGLGLAGVKALVERCGGEVEVASEEKAGSSFTVRLPLCDEAVT
jgi:signal transduction histidine kinase